MCRADGPEPDPDRWHAFYALAALLTAFAPYIQALQGCSPS
jgi:hypothetical protein